MKICSCKNKRFIIINDKPEPCQKCNNKGQYKLKEKLVCAGCGRDYWTCDCPCGSAKVLLIQNQSPRKKVERMRHRQTTGKRGEMAWYRGNRQSGKPAYSLWVRNHG